jgi:hypothetical protein
MHRDFLHPHELVDIEYSTDANPGIDSEANEKLMEEFIHELIHEIRCQFDMAISRKDIVDLDSTTTKKFSRHLIVHMPGGELFQDAIACGVFVKNFVGRLAEELATGQLQPKCSTLCKYLFVNSKPVPTVLFKDSEEKSTDTNAQSQNSDINVQSDKHDIIHSTTLPSRNRTCFVDTGVYTRNRLFRLFGSSKFGKPASAALRIASENQFPFPKGFGNEKVYVPAMEETLRVLSQKTNFPKDDNDDTMDDYCSDEESERVSVHTIGLRLKYQSRSRRCTNE